MRKLVWFTIGFSIAGFAGTMIKQSWLLWIAAAFLFLSIIFTVLKRRWKPCRIPLVIFLGCVVGFLWFYVYDSVFLLIPRVADGATLPAQIEVTDYSYENGYASAFEGNVILDGKSYGVKAYLNEKKELSPGDLVSGTFRFRLTTGAGREEATYHRTEGIFLLAYATSGVSVQERTEIKLQHYPAIWRRQLLTRIDSVFSDEAGAFASALILGERSKIDYELDTAFRVSGISHIIAVSGLHVSILCGLIFVITVRKRIISCVIGIPLLVLFAAIVGFTPSVTRACIMQSLMLFAMVINREYDPPTALAFSALTMMVINPLVVFSISFQLSMGCMMGIFMFSEKIRQWLLTFSIFQSNKSLIGKCLQGVSYSISVTLGAAAVTTPLVAYHFGAVSLIGILTNLLTVWIISFIFYGIIVCLIVSAVSIQLGTLIGYVIALPIQFVLQTARILSKFPLACVYTINPYVSVWLIGCYLLLGIFLLTRKKRPFLLINCIVFTLLISQMFSWAEPLQDDCRVTVLDVGQGQCILLQSDGKIFLVDCGSNHNENAADIAAETLLSQGISRLDGMILTHYDEDHAGGIAYLLSRISTNMLVLPQAEDEVQTVRSITEKTDARIQYVTEDIEYSFGETKITVFPPLSYNLGNESSLCILFQRKDCDILITGDRSAEGEKILMRNYALPELDLLIAGHHGAKNATCQELLAQTRPEIVVISVGAENHYGHPSEEVMERLQNMGCKIYRTDIHGTIVFRR